MLPHLSILLLTTFLSGTQIKATCYFPDGVTIDLDGFPCNTSSSASASQCCRTFEACLAGGACYTQWDSVMYRRSCTDRTFLNPACPRACLTGPSSKQAVGLLRCEGNTDPTYCCEEDTSTPCCNLNSTFHFIPGAIQGVLDAAGSLGTIAAGGSTVYTSTGLSATAISSANPTTSLSNLPPTLTTSGVSSAASSQAVSPSTTSTPSPTVIGLSVGLTLAAVSAVAAFGALFFYRRRRQRRESQRIQYADMAAAPGNIGVPRQELHGGMEPSELTADRPGIKHMK